MLLQNTELHQDIFTVNIEPEAILEIDDIDAYNKQEGLALSLEEVEYLDNLATN
jgi:phosphoribosylformylglycinamidine synthase